MVTIKHTILLIAVVSTALVGSPQRAQAVYCGSQPPPAGLVERCHSRLIVVPDDIAAFRLALTDWMDTCVASGRAAGLVRRAASVEEVWRRMKDRPSGVRAVRITPKYEPVKFEKDGKICYGVKSVDWKFTKPGSGRVVAGTWAGPALNLARQRDPQVALEDGHLANTGSHAVVVNYLRMNDGSFVALNPVMRLAAGERVPVPSAAALLRPSVIPPEAVESVFNPDTFGSDFYVLNGEQVVDRVVVRNLLPTSDDERGAFDRLEITVKADVEGDGAVGIATAGPFVLSAAGTRATEISIPFLRLARGQRQSTIEGRAYYAGGSYRTLKPTKFDTLSIAVTPDMFQ